MYLDLRGFRQWLLMRSFPSNLLFNTKLLSSILFTRFHIRSCDSLHICILISNHCSSLKDLKRIHDLIIATGSHKILLVSTKIITLAYTLSAQVDYAHKVFEQMPERDVVLWNTIIRGYSDGGPCHEASILYHKMHQDGVLADCYTFPFVQSSLVTVYSQGGEILKIGRCTEV